MSKIRSSLIRDGLSLIEVIFAIGIILIGLLGLLSILPLAGRRAQNAVSLTAAAAMGDTAENELVTRRWLGNARLCQRPYLASSTTMMTYNANTHVFANLPATVRGFCIDPIYCANQNALNNPGNRFNDAFFPYFDLNQNPLVNPSDPTAAAWPVNQPRMFRVGLADISGVPSATAIVERSRTAVETGDDLITVRPKDRTLASILTGLTSGTDLTYGKRVSSGELRWFATVSPLEGNRFASVSIVVVRNRDFTLDFPTPPGPPPPIGPETDPKKNGVNEQLAYVSDPAGFTGGAGGAVLLSASDTTLSDLHANDWIMLSRRTSPAATGVDVHRWFRIAAIDIEPTLAATDGSTSALDTVLNCYLPSSASGASVWVRRVLLDGPDWNFGLADDGATSNFGNNTFATIIPGVVSVTERVVNLADL